MKILITGANGYIGKSLYIAFKDKYDVTALTRKDFDLSNAKSTIEFFEGRYFDVVLHCAISGGSRLKEDGWSVADNNLSMYYNLVQCKSNYGKLINFGSGAEDYASDTPYGLSKKIIAESVINTQNFFNVKIYAIFDENELDTRFIKSNIKRYINKEPILIYENKRMTFFYMKDFLTLVEYMITTNSSKLMKQNYCGYGQDYTLMQIAEFINGMGEYEVPVLFSTKYGTDYTTNFNAGYGLNYMGLNNGIKEVYNKLKNEKL
jgi:nucleoside-diphosphate-sugar epimerase